MVFGEVLMAHLDDSLLDSGEVDSLGLRPVGRLGGRRYATVNAFMI